MVSYRFCRKQCALWCFSNQIFTATIFVSNTSKMTKQGPLSRPQPNTYIVSKNEKNKQNTSMCWILLTDFHSVLRIFVILWQKIKITFELLVRNHPELFTQAFFFSSHNWHALSPLCQHICDSPLHAVKCLSAGKWQHSSGLELWSIEKDGKLLYIYLEARHNMLLSSVAGLVMSNFMVQALESIIAAFTIKSSNNLKDFGTKEKFM